MELWLLELTVSYESGVADAKARKAAKYHDLVEAGREAGYRVKLFNVVASWFSRDVGRRRLQPAT